MEQASLSEYLRIFGKIIYLTILQYPSVTIIAWFVASLTLVSTYFKVKISDTISDFTTTFKTAKFSESLNNFFMISLLALVLRYVHKMIYTYTLQETCGKKFVYYLKEYLEMEYIDFFKKTPGELRFLIFLKAYSSVMWTNLVVFESSLLLVAIIFFFY